MQTMKHQNGVVEASVLRQDGKIAAETCPSDKDVGESDSGHLFRPLRDKQGVVRTHLAKRLIDALSDFQCFPEVNERSTPRAELPGAIVQDAVLARASDIHIEPGFDNTRVRFRIDGALSDVAALSTEQGKWLTNQFKALANLDSVARFAPKDSHARILLNGAAMDPCRYPSAFGLQMAAPNAMDSAIWVGQGFSNYGASTKLITGCFLSMPTNTNFACGFVMLKKRPSLWMGSRK